MEGVDLLPLHFSSINLQSFMHPSTWSFNASHIFKQALHLSSLDKFKFGAVTSSRNSISAFSLFETIPLSDLFAATLKAKKKIKFTVTCCNVLTKYPTIPNSLHKSYCYNQKCFELCNLLIFFNYWIRTNSNCKYSNQ